MVGPTLRIIVFLRLRPEDCYKQVQIKHGLHSEFHVDKVIYRELISKDQITITAITIN